MGNKDCIQPNGRRCTQHSKQPGKPKTISKACQVRGELRCKAHCRCGRNGTAIGRNAPRIFGAATRKVDSAERAPTRAVTEASVKPPVGWPRVRSTERLPMDAWWRAIVAACAATKEVEIATYNGRTENKAPSWHGGWPFCVAKHNNP